MNYFDILLAKKLDKGGGGEITIEGLSITTNGTYSEEGKAYTPVVVNVEGYKLEDMPTGAIASFNDGQALPLTKLLIDIKPVQIGSGDPSPNNEKPIYGWSACNINKSSINIWDEEWESGSFDEYGAPTPAADKIRSKNFNLIKKNKSFRCISTNNKTVRIYLYDSNKNFLSYSNITNTDFNVYIEAVYFKLLILDTTDYENDVSINYPSTDREYHAFNGTKIKIDFTDSGSPLIVYGATLDVLTGVLTVNNKKIRILTFSGLSSVYLGSFYISDGYIQDADVTKPIICNRLKYEGDTSQNFRYGTCINANQTGFNLWIKNGSFSSVSEAQQWLQDNETYIIYSLKTPETYQLTPTQINALLGVNNIFADAGDILEGEYFKAL